MSKNIVVCSANLYLCISKDVMYLRIKISISTLKLDRIRNTK
jgi:hypothetical protein